MRYLSEDEVTQMMGIGYLGEVRQGPDGNLYQYVQGVDGLGNPIGGFWSSFKKESSRVVRRALPFAQQFASFIPGWARQRCSGRDPILQKAGVAGDDATSVLSMRHPTAVSIRFRGWRRMKIFAASTKMK